MQTKKTSDRPVYVQLMDLIQPAIEALKLKRYDGVDWVVLRGTNGHRISIQKLLTKLPLVETTIPARLFEGLATEERAGGGTVVRIKPDPSVVEAALEFLNDDTIPLVPPKSGHDRSVPTKEQLLSRRK